VVLERVAYSRRNNWQKDEWILAYDVCPKVNQSYGPDAPFVIELADLLGRTPAAVSRAFGNLWAAQTNGRKGLKNRSHLADEVVSEYQDNLRALHSDALRLREMRVPHALTPRLEVVSNDPTTPITAQEVHEAAAASGLDSRLYFVTTRRGSFVLDTGTFLEALLAGTTGWLAITQTIQLIKDKLRERHGRQTGPSVELVSRTWQDIEEGNPARVEERVIRFYLGDTKIDKLSADDRARLVGFLSFLRGTRPIKLPMESSAVAGLSEHALGRPFSRSTLQRTLRLDLTSASNELVKKLSDLVKVSRSAGFYSALKSSRRRAKKRKIRL
jgi:hypothetical protein